MLLRDKSHDAPLYDVPSVDIPLRPEVISVPAGWSVYAALGIVIAADVPFLGKPSVILPPVYEITYEPVLALTCTESTVVDEAAGHVESYDHVWLDEAPDSVTICAQLVLPTKSRT